MPELTPEEKAEKAQRKKVRQEDLEEHKKWHSRTREKNAQILVDMEFDHLMSERNLKSMGQQIGYIYHTTKKSLNPLQVTLTGMQPSSLVHQWMQAQKALGAWDALGVQVDPTPLDQLVAQHADKQDFVYLSADSSNVLTTLEPSKKYIVGGLIDRNAHKNITFKKAQALGIAHAKFPVLDSLKSIAQVRFTKVLTCNHVVDIMDNFLASRNWKQACLKVIPRRKEIENTIEARDYVVVVLVATKDRAKLAALRHAVTGEDAMLVVFNHSHEEAQALLESFHNEAHFVYAFNHPSKVKSEHISFKRLVSDAMFRSKIYKGTSQLLVGVDSMEEIGEEMKGWEKYLQRWVQGGKETVFV